MGRNVVVVVRALAPASLLAAWVLVCVWPAPLHAEQDGVDLRGRVTTVDGAAIAGAAVSAQRGGGRRETTTDADGRFVLPLDAAGAWSIAVWREGFLTEHARVDVSGPGASLVVVLQPSLREEIAVVADRRPVTLAESPSSVAVVDRADIFAAGAARLDDVLRRVPGFSLFRRSGSRTANPTAQGVSLRGVGATGASRTLVVDDGVPLNDAFGGWIAWGRVPSVALDRVEVLRGGASDLYGSAALSGVIALVRREPLRPFAALDAWIGTQGSRQVAAGAGASRGRWSATASAEWFRTDGHVLITPDERGAVDVEAGTRHGVVDLTGRAQLGTRDRIFLRGAWFDEARENGTPLQVNDTWLAQAAAGWDATRGAHAVVMRAYASRQRYDQAFTAVAASRNLETLTRLQQVPADAAGASLVWTRAGRRADAAAGLEHRVVTGTSHERVFTGTGSFTTDAGGRQATTGAFAHVTVPLGAVVSLGGGLRYDRWESRSAARPVAAMTPAGREASAVSPRVTLRAALGPALALTASAYGAFRAPTLNELYRGFRVGNIITDANAMLDAERLTGIEAGVTIARPDGRLSARATAYAMSVRDPISNVTISASPSLVTRRRENLGRARSRGIELSLEARPASGWSMSAAYLLSDAEVTEAPAEPDLEGRRVPQVPRHAGSLGVRHAGARLGLAALQVRFDGRAYEDDRNTLALDGYVVVDALWSRAINDGPVSVFAAAENLTGSRYVVGRTPARTLGPPRSVRVGVRVGR